MGRGDKRGISVQCRPQEGGCVRGPPLTEQLDPRLDLGRAGGPLDVGNVKLGLCGGRGRAQAQKHSPEQAKQEVRHTNGRGTKESASGGTGGTTHGTVCIAPGRMQRPASTVYKD